MKVLHIISGNDNGGGGNHVLNLCSYGKDVMDSTIGCIEMGALYEKAAVSSVKTTVFSTKNIVKSLPRYVQEENIDIVDFHGAKPFLIHRMVKNRLTIPSAATVHSDYRYDFLNNKLKYHLFTPLSIFGLKSFRYYICVSEYVKNILINNGFTGKKYVVNNGIDFDSIYIRKNRDEIRNSLGIEESDFTYICVARLHPVKNHKVLLKAFAKVKNDIDGVKLILVGDGELETELREFVKKLGINEDVIFTGYKSNPVDYINAADISVLVSLNEGGAPPLAVLESAAVKKPVIASRVGDLQYILNDKTGFLLNNNSEESLYKKMKEAYLNKVDTETLGENLYKLVKNDFTMKSFCDKYYKSYREILEEN